MIILGTSLTVHPFASLPSLASPSIPRVLINLQKVGGIGSRVNDVVLLGECDQTIVDLCEAIGWSDELAERSGSKAKGKGKSVEAERKAKDKKQRDAEAQEKIEAIAREIEEKLKLDGDFKEKVVRELTSEKKENEYEDDYGLEYDPITREAPKKEGDVNAAPKPEKNQSKDGATMAPTDEGTKL